MPDPYTYRGDEWKRLMYAFDHMVGSFGTDAHAADSHELAEEIFNNELWMSPRELMTMIRVAEHVHGNYTYTGQAAADLRAIENGEK